MSAVFTALAAVLIFGLVIFIHELGHFLAAKYSGIKVNEFAIGMGPTLLHRTRGETTYALRLFPIGGFVSMEGEDEDSADERAFQKAPIGNRILVVVAGAAMNMILGFLVLVCLVSSYDSITSRTVSKFYDNAVSHSTGLEAGDTILSVNGRRCYIADDILYEFQRIDGGTAEIEVLRNGKKTVLPAVTFNTYEENGVTYIVPDFYVLPVEKSFTTVVQEAAGTTASYARMIVLSLVDLLTGRVAVNTLSGPVGIVSVISDYVDVAVTQINFEPLVKLLALITINLGIFNLLPLPALDGGRLFLLIVEAIRKKPVPQKYEIAINTAGFVLLMMLMVFVTYNDVTKLF